MSVKDKIVIVGFGFSGLSILANFIEKAKHPLHITIFDKQSVNGCGVAYGGDSQVHPLNVAADNMGLMDNRPLDFHDWLSKNKEKWLSLFPLLDVREDTYLPRKLYGLYLKSKLESLLEKAKEKNTIFIFLKMKSQPLLIKKTLYLYKVNPRKK